MKKRIGFCIMMTMAFLASGCSHAQHAAAQRETAMSEKNILIVYLSRTGNTKTVAELIHKKVGGDLVALRLQHPYPENYADMVLQVASENESNFLPSLQTKIEHIEKYDTIFVGFPTWGMQLPPPMKSFLSQYDLSGKTVIPFNTNAGYGIGSSFETVKKLAPKSKIPEGFSVKGGIEKEGILFVMEGQKKTLAETAIVKWLKKINLID